jgi:dUTP pyrophosphatase
MDLRAAVAHEVIIAPSETALIPCGIALAIPDGFEAQIRPRSGLASKYGISILNSPGTIDSDYRGEIKVILINHGATPFKVVRGMRIAQILVLPVPRIIWQEVEKLPHTIRGEKGYGHTGK